ncbi:MAG: GTP pyrophosphokinase family protein [Bacilli bacterium]|nr:GTP pyrophosphokinase family protein [Bacilli bacterium]
MELERSIEYQEMMLKYEFAKKKVETDLEILLREYAFKEGYNPVEHIKSRIKSYERIVEKLKRKEKEITVTNILSNVSDVVGMRIVCSFIKDVYTIADIIRSTGEFILKSEKDYIEEPKESGYRSYHMIVLVPIHLENRTEYIPVEIQIRTIAMDCWASLDHKLRYRYPDKISLELENEIVESANDMLEIDKKMQRISDVINKEV